MQWHFMVKKKWWNFSFKILWLLDFLNLFHVVCLPDLSTLKTTSAVPHPTSSSPSEGPRSTQELVTTAKPHSSCYQNITVVYPASSFCTHRGDGLYVKSRRPKTFYTCVQRKTFLTKCHIPGPPGSSAVTVTLSKDVKIVGCVLPTLFHLLCVWINGWFHFWLLIMKERKCFCNVSLCNCTVMKT